MEPFFNKENTNYYKLQEIKNKSFICGYCGDKVSSDRGFKIGIHGDGSGEQTAGIYICSNCQGPTFLTPKNEKFPGSLLGNSVEHLPNDLNELYAEARKCSSSKCYSASVILCRKMLMNISVNLGAEKNKNFYEYINYLSDNGYIPPNGKHWVDHIRKKGNDANHEITIMNELDAKEIITFTEMLLRFIYEFPNIIQKEGMVT